MTKRDFELVARVLRQDGHEDYRHATLIHSMAAALSTTNPRFDRARFIAAAMGEDNHDSAGRRVRYSTMDGPSTGAVC